MVGSISNSGLTKRSHPVATSPLVVNSTNNFFPGSYPTTIDDARDRNRGGFFKSCWLNLCSGDYNGLLCGCYMKEESRPECFTLLHDSIRSIIWFVLFSGFSVFLMFGPAIQSLIDTGTTGDLAFLYLRIIMFFFFSFDMLIRCVTEENYFVFQLFRRKDQHNPTSALYRSNTGSGDSNKSFFRFGSFLFWCDFLSTISILYDISFINNHHFDPVLYEIHLTGGIVDYKRSFGSKFNRLSLNSLEFSILVVIFRTARCARFVQSRAVVDAFDRLNCHELLRWLNPCYYCRLLKAKLASKRQNVDLDDWDNVSVMSAASIDDKTRKLSLMDTITLASYKIQTEEQGPEEPQIQKQPDQGQWKKIQSNEELTRLNEAAIKIQRNWRDRVQDISEDEFILAKRSNYFTLTSRSDDSALIELSVNEKSIGDNEISEIQIEGDKAHNKSQVRSDVRQSTGMRVAIWTLLILLFTVVCTYAERSTTNVKIMIVLHTQTKIPAYIERSLRAALSSSASTLYEYSPAVEAKTYYPNSNFNDIDLTPRNKVNITVTERTSGFERTSVGLFDNSRSIKQEAMVDLIATIFIIIFWFAGVVSFSGPVATLVITPVEQMLRLLGIITMNPLDYQSTLMYKNFLRDEDLIGKNTRWSSEVLKGMETSFLQSNILRIGSLMKVGFGSAGVEIIQNNLETGQNKNTLILNSQGTTVSCIFLFCDIRQFTDATEQLQEEVFVFTNQIAAVVHSICSSYGGAANKNIGDAFLLSWSLDEKGKNSGSGHLRAKTKQADKALLSVVKICISLAHDDFFLKPLSRAAIGRLKTKLKDRIGPVVQMGFGLHAGYAVQGAIGTQRKIDATYVAESVERAEFLESSTKKYGVNMLMSGEFHELLQSRNRERCRKVDKVLMLDQAKDEFMNLFTFDMDVSALQQSHTPNNFPLKAAKGRRQSIRQRRRGYGQRKSLVVHGNGDDDSNINAKEKRIRSSFNQPNFGPDRDTDPDHQIKKLPDLVLPNGPALYSRKAWSSYDIRKIRHKYVKSEYFLETYNAGLESFYGKDWDDAKKHFRKVLENFDDGPSKYFLAQIEKNNGNPPLDFKGYGIAE